MVFGKILVVAPIVIGLGSASAYSSALPADAPSFTRIELVNPSVRLWYEETGRLSANIAPPRKFNLWNIIVGEGDAEEHANDALFTIELKSDGEQNVPQPVTLSAIDRSGKVLAKRILRNSLTSKAGKLVAALWVRDVGCAGTVNFVAEMGVEKRAVSLDFSCGE